MTSLYKSSTQLLTTSLAVLIGVELRFSCFGKRHEKRNQGKAAL